MEFLFIFYFCSKEVINCYRKWMCIGIQNINQYQSSVLIFKLKFKQIYENRVHVHFYHTTLCISAVFAVVRCLSVHLSDCHVGGLYSHSWRYRQTSCLAWYLHHSSFLTPLPVLNSKGTPSAAAQNTCVRENFAIFNWNHRLSRIRYEKGPWFSLCFNGHFPSEPGLASVYWSKGWWKWWWQLEL